MKEIEEKIKSTRFHSHKDMEHESGRYLDTMKPYYDQLLDIVDKKLEINEKSNVLEVGSYLGYFAASLKHNYKCPISGMDHPDVFNNDVLELYEDFKIRPIKQNLNNYNFESNEFDFIFCFETFEHLRINIYELIQSISRSVKPGGHFMLTVPNINSLKKRIKLLFGKQILDDFSIFTDSNSPDFYLGVHWHEYNIKEMSNIVRQSNYVIDYATTINIKGNKNFFTIKNILTKVIPNSGDSILIIGKKL